MKKPCPLEEQDTLWEVFNDLKEEKSVVKNLDQLTEEFVIDKVKDALIKENWNQTRASNCLGIKRTTLIAMCKRLNIF